MENLKYFIQVEDGKVVGWAVGTDDRADMSSTYNHMKDWEDDAPNRIFISQDEPVELPAKHLKVVQGRAVHMTREEIQVADTQETTKRTQRESASRILADEARANLVAGNPLTQEQAEFLIPKRG